MPVVTATIKSNGKAMDPAFQLLSVDTTREFNKVPIAEIRLIDGDVARKQFDILEGQFFEPGKKIEIALKIEGQLHTEETIFTGIVVDQSLELTSSRSTTLTLELRDEAVKMTSMRKCAVHARKKDSEIIKKLVSQHKLKTGTITETKPVHPEMVQHYATDWDFMIARAEANGHLVITDDGEVSTIPPKVENPSLKLELGLDPIYNFDLQVNTRNQYQEVTSVAWDVTGQKLTKPAKGKEYKLQQGNYNLPDIAAAVGATEARLLHPTPMDPTELENWSDAQVMRSRLSLLRGWIKIDGNSKVKVGQTIEIQGVSKRFTGKNIISAVRHEYTNAGSWYTHIQIGMDACWFSSQSNIVDTQAAGLLPGVNGLQIGIVQGHEKDPSNQFRVKVNIPAFDEKGTVWARLTSIDAGKDRGIFFRPEKGDEVIVGFLNDDPRQAIILGATHSQANKTPVPVTAKNGQKGIITKSGYQLLFDEESEVITLSTPGKNQLLIDEKKGLVSLSDANKNQLEMSSKGVTIDSAKDMQITTKGNFSIKAGGNVKVEGKKVDLI